MNKLWRMVKDLRCESSDNQCLGISSVFICAWVRNFFANAFTSRGVITFDAYYVGLKWVAKSFTLKKLCANSKTNSTANRIKRQIRLQFAFGRNQIYIDCERFGFYDHGHWICAWAKPWKTENEEKEVHGEMPVRPVGLLHFGFSTSKRLCSLWQFIFNRLELAWSFLLNPFCWHNETRRKRKRKHTNRKLHEAIFSPFSLSKRQSGLPIP